MSQFIICLYDVIVVEEETDGGCSVFYRGKCAPRREKEGKESEGEKEEIEEKEEK